MKRGDKTLRNHAIAIAVAKGLDAKSAATRHDIEQEQKQPVRRKPVKRGPSKARLRAMTKGQRR